MLALHLQCFCFFVSLGLLMMQKNPLELEDYGFLQHFSLSYHIVYNLQLCSHRKEGKASLDHFRYLTCTIKNNFECYTYLFKNIYLFSFPLIFLFSCNISLQCILQDIAFYGTYMLMLGPTFFAIQLYRNKEIW